MPRLKIEDLKKIQEKNRAIYTLRKGGYRGKVVIHMGTCGIAAGAREVMRVLIDELTLAGVDDVIIKTAGCGGLCAREPMAVVELIDQPPVVYGDLNEEKIKEIFREHIMGGNPVERYALAIGSEVAS